MKLPRSLQREFPNVKTCRDAKHPVTIHVIANDCKIGKRKQSAECALAVATKRQFHAEGAVIGLSYSYLIKNQKAIRFKTPETVAREIVSFDRHHDFAAGSYKLSQVSPSGRLNRKTYKQRPGGHQKNRIVHKQTVRVRVMK